MREVSSHGGARPGAGRPRLPENLRARFLGVTIPGELFERVEQYATQRELARSHAVAELLERALPRRARPKAKVTSR